MSHKPCEEIRLYGRQCLPNGVRTTPVSFFSFRYVEDYTFSLVGLPGQRNLNESDTVGWGSGLLSCATVISEASHWQGGASVGLTLSESVERTESCADLYWTWNVSKFLLVWANMCVNLQHNLVCGDLYTSPSSFCVKQNLTLCQFFCGWPFASGEARPLPSSGVKCGWYKWITVISIPSASDDFQGRCISQVWQVWCLGN